MISRSRANEAAAEPPSSPLRSWGCAASPPPSPWGHEGACGAGPSPLPRGPIAALWPRIGACCHRGGCRGGPRALRCATVQPTSPSTAPRVCAPHRRQGPPLWGRTHRGGGSGVGVLGGGCVHTPLHAPPPPSPAAAATRRAAGTATRRRRTPSSSTGRGVPGGCGRGAPVLRAGGGGGRPLVSANEPRAARPPALRCWCGWHSAMGGAGGNPHRGHRPRVALSGSSSPVPHRSPDVGRGVPISSPPPVSPRPPAAADGAVRCQRGASDAHHTDK